MRKITLQIVSAFLARTTMCNGNSSTDGTSLYLHGNEIARHGADAEGVRGVFITLAGWNSRTTKERLKGLLSLMSEQHTVRGRDLGFTGGAAGMVTQPLIISIWTKDFTTYVGPVEVPERALELSGRDWLFVSQGGAGLRVREAVAVGMGRVEVGVRVSA